MLGVLYTQDSKVEDMFYGAPYDSELYLFFSSYLFGMGFKTVLVQLT